jgi:outer membrane protein TolC
MIPRFPDRVLAVLLLAVLAGCASYRPSPLVLAPPLAGSLAGLDHAVPGRVMIDTAAPLSLSSVAALAVLNDPALAAARAQQGVATAQLFAAGLLPDPVLSGALGALLGGPGVAPSIAGSLVEDVSALVTRGVRVRAARAVADEARAQFFWQEWQVAAQAETLATLLWAEQRNLAILNRERAALQQVVDVSRRAVANGNLTIGEGAIAASNLAALDATRDALAQQALADHAALAALLGLEPQVPIPLAAPRTAPVSGDLVPGLVQTLALRRPDLIALRLGYLAADATLRGTILSEFSGLTLGITGGSDTSRVATIGPTVSLNLPIFNRNRGNIMVARATRRQLKAEFNASLASAEGGAQQAELALRVLERERAAARTRLAEARRDTAGAAGAFRNGLIDLLSYTSLISQEATRQTELTTLDQKIAAGRIALASLLAPALPTIRVTSIKAGYHQ